MCNLLILSLYFYLYLLHVSDLLALTLILNKYINSIKYSLSLINAVRL